MDYSSDGGSTFATYYYLRNAQNDVISLIDGTGTTVVQYVYDSWGKLIATTGSLATSLGQDQPFRYRGYVYDSETGWYYLQSRYYNPETCRFISADVLLSTGQGVLGHNAYAYCLNNPMAMSDSGGARPDYWDDPSYQAYHAGASIRYTVPCYSQGQYSLCWAFCQVMIESYQAGITLTQSEAATRACEIAQSCHDGENNWDSRPRMDTSGTWNRGGWPTDAQPLSANESVNSLYDLYCALQKYGPLYAYYCGDGAHMVVVTGVDLAKGTVYSNNPWGYIGAQTYTDFLEGFVHMYPNWNMEFGFCMTAS